MYLKTGFHLLVVVYHVAVLYNIQALDFSASTHEYVINLDKFSWRFLTAWNFMLQTCYFTVCLLGDVLELSPMLQRKAAEIQSIRQFMFCVFAFPLSLTVAVMFWVLFTLDRNLVYPPEVDSVIPTWINHAIHTNIVFFILVEFATTFHRYHRSRKRDVLALTAYSGVYCICYLSTYIVHGVWLYPVFDQMSWTQRAVFALMAYVLLLAFYLLGEGLTTKVWGKRRVW